MKNVARKVVPDSSQDMMVARRYHLELRPAPSDDEHDYAELPNIVHLSQFSESCVGYIAGYVVKMVRKKLRCTECLSALAIDRTSIHQPSMAYGLISQKDRGGLITPSDCVVRVCAATERCVKRMLTVTDGRIPRTPGIQSAIAHSVLAEVGASTFESLSDHMFDSEADNNHVFSLIRSIAECYCKVRFHHLVRTINDSVEVEQVRKKLTKLIIFVNQ